MGRFGGSTTYQSDTVRLLSMRCPECEKLILRVQYGHSGRSLPSTMAVTQTFLIYPPFSSRSVAAEVPEALALTFQKASAILPISPEASAALSRRLLQHTLQEHLNIKKGNLDDQIEEFKRQGIPLYLSEPLDAIRKVGNFAAHPIKNTNTGEVVPVEPGEAEWLLEVLEFLFDFAFIQPKKLEERKAALNAKLEAANKPPMK